MPESALYKLYGCCTPCWCATLAKPAFNPPNWVFAPVWTVLYLMIAAVGVIVALLAAIVANTSLFWKIERAAGWLLVPYAAWVAFATVLNAALWWLN